VRIALHETIWYQTLLDLGWREERLAEVGSYMVPGAVIMDLDDEVRIYPSFRCESALVFGRGPEDPVVLSLVAAHVMGAPGASVSTTTVKPASGVQLQLFLTSNCARP